MGYYTYFTISMIGDEKDVEDFKKDLLEQSKDNNGEYDSCLEELLEDSCAEGKLYDLADWISAVAPSYPNVIVILNGDGEESGDLWEERWKGDKEERQRAVIPPFTTPELLTDYEKEHKNI